MCTEGYAQVLMLLQMKTTLDEIIENDFQKINE